jgi:hypothetical protein
VGIANHRVIQDHSNHSAQIDIWKFKWWAMSTLPADPLRLIDHGPAAEPNKPNEPCLLDNPGRCGYHCGAK